MSQPRRPGGMNAASTPYGLMLAGPGGQAGLQRHSRPGRGGQAGWHGAATARAGGRSAAPGMQPPTLKISSRSRAGLHGAGYPPLNILGARIPASRNPDGTEPLRVHNRKVIEADRRPGILARMLGSMLQTAREVAGLSYDQAAARLGCETDWLIRVETGFGRRTRSRWPASSSSTACARPGPPAR